MLQKLALLLRRVALGCRSILQRASLRWRWVSWWPYSDMEWGVTLSFPATQDRFRAILTFALGRASAQLTFVWR